MAKIKGQTIGLLFMATSIILVLYAMQPSVGALSFTVVNWANTVPGMVYATSINDVTAGQYVALNWTLKFNQLSSLAVNSPCVPPHFYVYRVMLSRMPDNYGGGSVVQIVPTSTVQSVVRLGSDAKIAAGSFEFLPSMPGTYKLDGFLGCNVGGSNPVYGYGNEGITINVKPRSGTVVPATPVTSHPDIKSCIGNTLFTSSYDTNTNTYVPSSSHDCGTLVCSGSACGSSTSTVCNTGDVRKSCSGAVLATETCSNGAWANAVNTQCSLGCNASTLACNTVDLCANGVQDTGELGVDCGGTCATACLTANCTNNDVHYYCGVVGSGQASYRDLCVDGQWQVSSTICGSGGCNAISSQCVADNNTCGPAYIETDTKACTTVADSTSQTGCATTCTDLSWIEQQNILPGVRNKTVMISAFLMVAGILLWTGKKLW